MRKDINIAEKLEDYCQDTVAKYPESGREWVFGAIDFAYGARLIDSIQYITILKKYQYFTEKMDPSGGNRMGSSK